MPTRLSLLADRATVAADTIRDLLDEAQAAAAQFAPPVEVFALAHVLGRWADRLREADQDQGGTPR